MQAHQQRVVEEKKELDIKGNALSRFINESPIFQTLDTEEQDRLTAQQDVMWQYSKILGERLVAVGICPECYEEGMEVYEGVLGCACGYCPDAE